MMTLTHTKKQCIYNFKSPPINNKRTQFVKLKLIELNKTKRQPNFESLAKIKYAPASALLLFAKMRVLLNAL